jgi:hypothetical protein
MYHVHSATPAEEIKILKDDGMVHKKVCYAFKPVHIYMYTVQETSYPESREWERQDSWSLHHNLAGEGYIKSDL